MGSLQSAHEVLDHHDRRVDEQAEVERSEAHQIRRHAELLHHDEHNEQRQRNDRRRQQGRAEDCEEHEQNQDHERAAFEQVLEYRPRGPIDDLTLVVKRADRDTGRQQCPDLAKTLLDKAHDVASVGAFQHDDHAGHRLSVAITRHGALARHRPRLNVRDVPDVHGRAARASRDHHIGDVRGVSEATEPADAEALASMLQIDHASNQ